MSDFAGFILVVVVFAIFVAYRIGYSNGSQAGADGKQGALDTANKGRRDLDRDLEKAIAHIRVLDDSLASSRKVGEQSQALIKNLQSAVEVQQKRAAEADARARTLGASLANLESAAAANTERVIEAEAKARDLEAELRGIQVLHSDLEALQAAIDAAEALLASYEPVIYPRSYPEESSAALKARMDDIRDGQKEIAKRGQIVINFGAAIQAKLPPVEREKQKSLIRMARLALVGAADALVESSRATNLERLDKRFTAIVGDINRLLRPWALEIGRNYQATVRESLALMAEYQQQLAQEREEQRAIREQMREEAIAQREAERAEKEAEQDEKRALRELERAQEAADRATEQERSLWLEKVAALEAALQEAKTAKARAIAMAQLTKTGHVYVISNVGSFGQDIYKVGMTRRLDPMDRVAELGDASVPFAFDVHGIIPSKDAPALEAALHRELEPYRVNLVNGRKEFFHVPIGHLKELVLAKGAEVQLTEAAEAEEWRQSQALRQGIRRPAFALLDEVGAEETEDDDLGGLAEA